KLAALKKRGALPMIEGEDALELVREDGGWRVFNNWSAAVRVRFRAEVKEGLPWEFRPLQEVVRAKPGETLQAFYEAKNLSDKPVTAKALHIDAPKEAEKYLEIIQCFCLIRETLRPGESKKLPLTFRVKEGAPEDVKEFEVHYQFYPLEKFPQNKLHG
ncbi:MAG TPA: cytochrome c oxidase assembly protein, partial [Candidatus Binatia bacterium]